MIFDTNNRVFKFNDEKKALRVCGGDEQPVILSLFFWWVKMMEKSGKKGG